MNIAVFAASRGEGEHLSQLLAQFQKEFFVPVQVDILEGTAPEEGLDKYDMALLDGGLPDCLAVGMRLREQRADRPIVLFAGDNRAALLAYAIHPDGFLPKPVRYPAVRAVMERCRSCWQGEARAVELVANRVSVRILCGDIEYLEMQGRMLTLRGRYGQVESRTSMLQMEKQVEGLPFLACQRGCLVNLFRVREWRQDGVLMESGALLPVSAERRDLMLACWHRFWRTNPLWAAMLPECAGI